MAERREECVALHIPEDADQFFFAPLFGTASSGGDRVLTFDAFKAWVDVGFPLRSAPPSASVESVPVESAAPPSASVDVVSTESAATPPAIAAPTPDEDPLRRIFDACDKTQFGKISWEDLRRGMAERREECVALHIPEDADQFFFAPLFGTASSGGDRVLTFDAFKAWVDVGFPLRSAPPSASVESVPVESAAPPSASVDVVSTESAATPAAKEFAAMAEDPLRRLYASCDRDQRGAISWADLQRGIAECKDESSLLRFPQDRGFFAPLFDGVADDSAALTFDALKAWLGAGVQSELVLAVKEPAPPESAAPRVSQISADDPARRLFEACDTSQQGQISFKELRLGITLQPEERRELGFPSNPKREFFGSLFDAGSSDDDPVLTFDAFKAWLEAGIKAQPVASDEARDVLYDFFLHIDKDRSGYISKPEFVRGLWDNTAARRLLGLPDHECGNELSTVWDEADVDDDNRLSFEELRNYYSNLWRRRAAAAAAAARAAKPVARGNVSLRWTGRSR